MAEVAMEKVRLARANNRPGGKDYIENIFLDFFELHGDRCFGDDPAVVGGVALLGSRAVTVIAIEKGHGIKERVARNFGAPNPEGYRKARRLMLQAEKFGRPVVCFVDTSGACCGIEAEERGQGQAVAESILTMMGLKVPIVSLLVGEGGSGGALALAAADEVWMLENAVYSVISPEGCASILWKDVSRAPEAAECLRLTAEDAVEFGVVEKIISENDLGSEAFYRYIRFALESKLSELCELESAELTTRRYERFRKTGRVSEK